MCVGGRCGSDVNESVCVWKEEGERESARERSRIDEK